MKFRHFALTATAFALAACNGNSERNKVEVGLLSSDEVKISYTVGTQLGNQLKGVQSQLDFAVKVSEFENGILDGNRMVRDTSATGNSLKYPDSVMNEIARGMQNRAMSIQMAKMPQPKKDSTDTSKAPQPEMPAAMTSEEASRASYLMGVQFGAQFASLSEQANMDMNLDAFRQGVWDFEAFAKDSSKALRLPQDSLQAVSMRLRDKILEARKAAIEKQKAEEEAVKKAIEPLRGDTLPDGTQAKMNFKVKASGVNVSAENLEAYAGSPLFVFYFSTTCGHCRHATPEIKEIANAFRDKGIRSIAVASGGNNKRAIRAFIEEYKLDEAKIDVFFDEAREFGELYSDGYVPKVYVVKPDGSLMTFKNFEQQKDSIQVELGKLTTK